MKIADRIIRVPGTKNKQSKALIKCDAFFWPTIIEAVPCPVTASGLYQTWKKARKKAGAIHARIHDLRHSFGQWSLDGGVLDSEVQQALRHSDPKMTADYRRLQQSDAASRGLADVIRGKQAAVAARLLAAQAAPAADGTTSLSENTKVLSLRKKVPQSREDTEKGASRDAPLSAYIPLLHMAFPKVAREGIEPPTRGFSVRCSTN